tara:strand:+ start:553 stop:726 length:174 start_codon:yes stop_codon:yes gene_type:complete
MLATFLNLIGSLILAVGFIIMMFAVVMIIKDIVDTLADITYLLWYLFTNRAEDFGEE